MLRPWKYVRKIGDVGLGAEELMRGRKVGTASEELSCDEVYERLMEIALESGEGSQERKLSLLQDLLKRLDPVSDRYVVRIVMGKMRLGFSLMTILDAMSWTKTSGKSESKLLEETFQKKADIAKLAAEYLFEDEGAARREKMKEYKVEVGVPVVAALCQRLNSAADIIEKMERVYAEPKYDGMRVQIHFAAKENGDFLIKAFTRNMEDVSAMYPELHELGKMIHGKGRSFILDSEAVGFNPETGKMLIFQETITRKRKHDVEAKAESVPVCFHIFDILSLDGEDLLEVPCSERKKVLKKLMKEIEGHRSFELAPDRIFEEAEGLRLYHEELLAAGLEGAVVKQIDSAYQSGRKGWAWVKIKEEEGRRGKLNDTLDLVVMGYYVGKGKRTGFGVGAFLAGVGDDKGGVLSLSKIGTGLTDDQFREMKRRAKEFEVSEEPKEYEAKREMRPDVWLAPGMVVEIAADELTNSSLHTSGKSLRFPRLIKWRDDKDWEEATSLSELAEIRIA